jgi:hypothetical protein
VRARRLTPSGREPLSPQVPSLSPRLASFLAPVTAHINLCIRPEPSIFIPAGWIVIAPRHVSGTKRGVPTPNIDAPTWAISPKVRNPAWSWSSYQFHQTPSLPSTTPLASTPQAVQRKRQISTWPRWCFFSSLAPSPAPVGRRGAAAVERRRETAWSSIRERSTAPDLSRFREHEATICLPVLEENQSVRMMHVGTYAPFQAWTRCRGSWNKTCKTAHYHLSSFISAGIRLVPKESCAVEIF